MGLDEGSLLVMGLLDEGGGVLVVVGLAVVCFAIDLELLLLELLLLVLFFSFLEDLAVLWNNLWPSPLLDT